MNLFHTHIAPAARLGALLTVGVLLVLTAGCARHQDRNSDQVTAAGSTSVTPFAEQLAEGFMAAHRGMLINIQGIGSTAGIQATEIGAADIGMSSRSLEGDETQKLLPIPIALDAMAIIVNPANPVRNLSLEQVRRIYAGKILNWQEVGGNNALITLVNREAGSGTRGAFEELAMGKHGPKMSDRSLRQGSNGAVRAVVAGDPNAIGYISLGIVNNQVRALSVDQTEPSSANIHAGRYRLVRPFLFLIRKGTIPSRLSEEYMKYVLSDEGQQTLVKAGLIAVPHKELPWKD